MKDTSPGTQPVLHVVAVVSNPQRYRTRYKLYHEFAERMGCNEQVELHTIEVALRNREFQCQPFHKDGSRLGTLLQLSSNYEIWHKENMFNICLSRLPAEAEYVAMIDADVSFSRNDWALETIHQLQHHPIVQMFSHSVDLGPSQEPILQREGFGWAYQNGKDMLPPSRQDYSHKSGNYHPGYAWAFRRSFLDEVGGLMDLAIVGSADYHMAYGIIGRGQESAPVNVSPNYHHMIASWQDRALRSARGNLGYVPTTLFHYWHGKKVDRRYGDRWKILLDNVYDPYADVFKDANGLLRLSGTKPKLRHDLMAYFRSRNEDSIDNDE